MSLPGNDLLTAVESAQDVPTLAVKLGQYLRTYVATAIQNTASNAAVGASGNIPAPAPPESVQVVTSGELMQVVVNHVAPVTKGARHIIHIATNPQFTNALIRDEGASRSPSHYSLPTKDSGGNTHKYYVGAVIQYPGSPPSSPTYFGGVTPSPVTMGGTTQMDIMPGTGSGTATNGGQTFVGLGKAQVRL
jgi:hypothetical protein